MSRVTIHVEGLVIDDEADFKDFLENNHQYWDYVDDELLAEKHGKCRVTFYLEESESGFSTLAQVRIALSALKKQHPEYAPLLLTMENVEDADWENNWKQFYKPMEIGERLLVIPEWEQETVKGQAKYAGASGGCFQVKSIRIRPSSPLGFIFLSPHCRTSIG